MESEDLDGGALSVGPSTSIFLNIADDNERQDQQSIRSVRKRWLDALGHCAQSTLRSLSYPTFAGPGRYLRQTSNEEHDANTRQAVMEILASGLPLPKSPSAQMCESEEAAFTRQNQKSGSGHGGGREGNENVAREREERGWWALRFQQTLNEMQRESASRPPPLQQIRPKPAMIAPSAPMGTRKVVTGRKPLKLGSKK